MKVCHKSECTSSPQLVRAAAHLELAERQILAALQSAPNRYLRKRLHRLRVDLRVLTYPIDALVESLNREGQI